MPLVISTVLQVLVASTLLWVWLVRSQRPTDYRGGAAKSLKEEFAVYGLPSWSLYLIGGLKVGSAVALLAGYWFPSILFPVAVLLSFLMAGAIIMHFKVSDPLKKAAPASTLFVCCIAIALANYQ